MAVLSGYKSIPSISRRIIIAIALSPAIATTRDGNETKYNSYEGHLKIYFARMPECNQSNSAVIDLEPVADWLNKEYIQNALRKYKCDDNLKVLRVDFKSATAKGENYASVMTRARVEFLNGGDSESHVGSYIVKTSFEGDEFASEKMNEYDVYNREMEVYEKIMPKLSKMLKDVQDDDKLFAEVISVDYDHTAMIFEDLSVNLYVLAERKEGLDMTHAKMVLRKLAKMHAASAVLNERSPETFKHYDRGMFNRHTNAFSPFFEGTLVACGEMVSQWDGEYKMYGKKILKLKPKLMEYGREVFDAKEDQFNCLVHGDLWTNNVMFTYNDKQEPTDVIMIDFQFSCWASPAVDLHYFFNTSLREELRLHHQDELLQYYYNILANTLRNLKYNGKIPTLHEFWIQCAEKSFYAFTSACIVQPVMLNEETENADFHALMGEDDRARNFKKILYSNEKVQKNLKRLLPHFDRRGLIDVN